MLFSAIFLLMGSAVKDVNVLLLRVRKMPSSKISFFKGLSCLQTTLESRS